MTELSENEIIVPDAIEPMVGYRAWRLSRFKISHPDRGERTYYGLMSVVRTTVWPPCETMQAVCHHDHRPAAKGCSCGLYAKSDYFDMLMYAVPYGKPMVYGRVKLYGQVTPGSVGFRAELGDIDALYDSSKVSRRVLEQIAKLYDVPIIEAPKLTRRQTFYVKHATKAIVAVMFFALVFMLVMIYLCVSAFVDLPGAHSIGKIIIYIFWWYPILLGWSLLKRGWKWISGRKKTQS